MLKLFICIVIVSVIISSEKTFSQVGWTKYPTPVLDVGSPGSWDDQWAIASRVIQVGDTLKMWYSGRKNPFGILSIGYAWSTDGIMWTKDSLPVLTPTQAWETQYVWQPYVIKDSLYKMWYNGGSGGGAGSVGYAWSVDGIQWIKYLGNPVVSPGPMAWDAENIEEPCVIADGIGGFKMWYEGVPFGLDTLSVGYAIATNETTWTKANNINPLLSPLPGTWEPTWLRSPRVLINNGNYEMLYSAGPPFNNNSRGIGYATSIDGINWVRDSTNPVLQSTPGTWDEGGIWVGDIMYSFSAPPSERYKLWYTAGYLTTLRTGYATATVTSVEEISGEIPTAFALKQNYPNPFNPETNIRFRITEFGFVSLKIYDILGNEVAALVNEEKPAGNYEVEFNVSSHSGGSRNLSSGIYFYKLTAGSFVETKKMLLLK